MRLDKFLKVSRLLVRRTKAQEACDKNHVTVNGNVSKSGKRLKIGDIVEISFAQNKLKFKVLSLDEKTKKDQAENMYELLF